MLDRTIAAIVKTSQRYNSLPPFHPELLYPEYAFAATSADVNPAYDGVRRLFNQLGMDAENFGGREWNPLGALVRPGDRVIIKPNWVMDRCNAGVTFESLVTHGSIIRAVLDYVFLALKGKGRVSVIDTPLLGTDFERLRRLSGIDSIADFYKRETGFEIEIIDGRAWRLAMDSIGTVTEEIRQTGDPRGYVTVDLGRTSSLDSICGDFQKFAVADGRRGEMQLHHTAERHEYLIPRTILEADVVFNLPKMKTHVKAGVTLALKNLVGICGDKNYLPHHREGSLADGGDEYPEGGYLRRVKNRVADTLKRSGPVVWQAGRVSWKAIAGVQRRFVSASSDYGIHPVDINMGGWFGNRTLWRMILDLNKILFYADAEGALHDEVQRRYFCLVDAIVAGEGEGPLFPTAKPCGIVVGGENPLAVDLACLKVMGYDWQRVPKIRGAFELDKYRLASFNADDVSIISDGFKETHAPFKEPASWRDHLINNNSNHKP
jgi:uncharacterized protein (DUF362 family)